MRSRGGANRCLRFLDQLLERGTAGRRVVACQIPARLAQQLGERVGGLLLIDALLELIAAHFDERRPDIERLLLAQFLDPGGGLPGVQLR